MTFQTSPTTAKLDAALAKAQGEIETASKDKTNPAFRSKYADLAAVREAIQPALAKHGISVTQWPVHSDDGRVHLCTRVAHDGEWMCCVFSIPVTKADAHGYGSAVTYLKRYALAAAIGVVADEDDDGNAASASREPSRKEAPTKPAKEDAPAKPAKPTAEQETKALDWVASIEEAADMDALQHRFKRAYAEIHPLGFDGLTNLIVAAKDTRKRALAEQVPA